jgi:hypothetical protein
MKHIDIKAGKLTPRISYNPDNNTFSISGSSLPENVHEFYKPVLQWFDEYEAVADKIAKPLKISVKLAYYNSSSMRYIHDIFAKIAKIHQKGIETSIDWHYEKDDDILREAGQDLAEIVGMKFNFITS